MREDKVWMREKRGRIFGIDEVRSRRENKGMERVDEGKERKYIYIFELIRREERE